MSTGTLLDLGPVPISKVTREMVAEVTLNHRAPLIVSEEIDGETVCAVVTHNPCGSHPSKKVKDGLRVVCAACYKEGASLNDDRFAKTFSSCLSHTSPGGSDLL